MDAASFYSGEAEYLLNTRKLLAENGTQVLRALRSSRFDGPQTSAAGIAPIPEVDLNELSGFSNGTVTQSGSLTNLSGHVRVTNPEGDIEEYYMSITPHLLPLYNTTAAAKGGTAQQAAAGEQPSDNAYIALDVDQFYVTEDENGEEIWPVTIPAQSLSHPEEIIEVTVHEGGRLEWPEEALKSSTASSNGTHSMAFASTPELNYLSANEMAIIQPSDGGGGGGGTTTSSFLKELDDNFIEFKIVEGPYLSLKTLRLHTNKEGNKSEILMNVSKGIDDNKQVLFRKFAHSFDRKRGLANSDIFRKFSGTITSGLNMASDRFADSRIHIIPDEFSFYPVQFADVVLEEAVSNSPLFDGKNQRTIGADFSIYEVPDINQPGIKYDFKNMKKWMLKLFARPEGKYFEINSTNAGLLRDFGDQNLKADYYPVVPLGESYSDNTVGWKFILTENDKKYVNFSKQKFLVTHGRIKRKVWMYNMATGQHNFENMRIGTKAHWFGNSDEILERSGVKNITLENANRRLRNNEIKVQKDNFQYVFTVDTREILVAK